MHFFDLIIEINRIYQQLDSNSDTNDLNNFIYTIITVIFAVGFLIIVRKLKRRKIDKKNRILNKYDL